MKSLLLAVCMIGLCCTCDSQKDNIRKAIENQMQIYPESTLRDLYKNFFQDRFGPGHIVSDTTSAGAYLREELAAAQRFDGLPYEPTGYNGNFYRVNLSLVKDGIIPYAVYFDAFVRSVNSIRPMPVEGWKKEWALISSVISDMDLHLNGYKRDSLEIDSLLGQGKNVMHHSRSFTDTYDPHYRIIGKQIFEEELLPLIEEYNKKNDNNLRK